MSTHLHTRSAYTLLNSTLSVREIVSLAKEDNQKAIALCDRFVMHGAMQFYHTCKKEGIKPIFALEVDCVYEEDVYTLHLYAKGDIGFQSLLKLSTRVSTSKEVLTLEELQTYDKQMIVTTSGCEDKLNSFLLSEDSEALSEVLLKFKNTFHEFYVAIAMNDSKLLAIKNVGLKGVAASLKIKTFALSRIYYAADEDEEAYKVMCAIEQQKMLEDQTLSYTAKRFYRTEREMEQLYEQDDLDMSDEIADMCQVEMKMEKAKLPKFKNKFGVDSKTYLTSLCKEGLKKRLGDSLNDEYIERLNYELGVICKMNYEDYFLIVYDFIRYARSKDVYVGPGRGSAAGSLISYCLGITHVDPIQYNLLFERFLNPERISMPDIDIDFPDNRRDEIIEYVTELYGSQCVAHITTFGTLAAKQVIRDVGRVMRVNLRDIDMLTKMIPNMIKVNLTYAFEKNANFKKAILASKQFKALYDIALKLEGLPRHTSTHAAGIVLSDKPIEEVCPLIRVEDDLNSSQYTMEYLEELGLIKIDFLGLRNLTIIDEVCTHIHQQGTQLDIMKIPLDDFKTFEMLRDVDTVGIFQLESEGMKSLIRRMQIRNFEEIVAAIALFRPGPMENIPLYLENRSHANNIDYLHENLKPILENTYGVMIYQEQIMQVTQVMANFSLGKADILRKAISKKVPKELEKLQKSFIEGSMKNGYEEKFAIHVYDLILKFAGYGFNRSHSVAYGLIAYQMAYLKANYPLSFFASLLNSVIGSETKSSEYIFEAKKRGIKVNGPSVQYSLNKYVLDDKGLRYPLVGIKNIGSAMSLLLLKERNENGTYEDYFDFIARVSLIKVTKKAIESLIDAGALDDFRINRASMKASLDDALRYASLVKIEHEGQIRLDFELVSKPPITTLKEFASEKSRLEKDVLGFYLSEHPITSLRNSMNKDLLSLIQLQHIKGYVKFIAIIDRCKQHRTKHGDLMMFVVVSDETSKYDIVCMPNVYKQHQDILVRGNYIYVEGKIDDRNSCLVNTLKLLNVDDTLEN